MYAFLCEIFLFLTLLCVTDSRSRSTETSAWCSAVEGWDGGGREVREGGDICTHVADSLQCTTETNTSS